MKINVAQYQQETKEKREKEIKIKNKAFCEDRLHSNSVYLQT